MNDTDNTELHAAAVALTKAGFRVLQIHYVKPDGGCSCSLPTRLDPKHSIGKHPTVKKWQESEKFSLADVFSIWGEPGPPWNLGVATGGKFFVLDYDPKSAGEEAEKLLETDLADHAPTVITGSGGTHWWFRIPDGLDFQIGNSSGRLPKGFDIRGTGGQVVVPPSVSGVGPYVACYEGVPELLDPPAWLIDAIRPERTAPEITEEDKKEYEALSGEKKARVDRYTNRAVSRIEAKLKALKDVPMDTEPRWDETVFKLACDLLEIANTPWTSYTKKDAYASVFANAPRDSGFDDMRVNAKFESAEQKTAGKSRPAPDWLRKPEPTPDQGKRINADEIPLEDARLVEFIAADLCKHWKWSAALGWLKWDGKRWRPGRPDPEPRNAVREWVIKLLRRTKDGARIKLVSQKLTSGAVGALTNLLRGVDGIFCDAEDFDTDPDLLNCPNGVVDLRTGELLPHDPLRLITKLAGAEYEPGFTTPDWEKAKLALPADSLEWMQLRLGQAATGHTPPDDLMIICHGGGENGKSSIMEPTTKALGEFSVLVSDRIILASNDAHPTEMMDLRGARLALLEETPEARRLNVARLKKLIGGSEITARRIAKDPVTYPTTHSFFVNTNYELQVDETDRGTWRRLARLVFPYTYKKKHEPLESEWDRYGDPGLRDRLKMDRDSWKAALAWMVEGAKRWYEMDRVMPEPPKRVQDDTLKWRAGSDVIMGFFSEAIEPDPNSHIASVDLLEALNAYLIQRGQKGWSDKLLASRLQGHELAMRHRLELKRFRLSAEGLSRPGKYIKPDAWGGNQGLAKPLPAQFRAWTGIRFRDPTSEEGA